MHKWGTWWKSFGATAIIIFDWVARMDFIYQHKFWMTPMLDILREYPILFGVFALGIFLWDVRSHRITSNSDTFSDAAARVYPHLSNQGSWWKKLKLYITPAQIYTEAKAKIDDLEPKKEKLIPIKEKERWLSPKDAFIEFSEKEWILALNRYRERHQQAWLKKELAENELKQIPLNDDSRFSPLMRPLPDEWVKANDKFKSANIEYNSCVNAHNVLRGEIVKAMCKKLEDGVLKAKGIKPGTMGVVHDIPDFQWTILQLDIDKAEAYAEKEKLSYSGIRISKP